MAEFFTKLVVDHCAVVALDGWKIGGWFPENHLIRSTGHSADALAPPAHKETRWRGE